MDQESRPWARGAYTTQLPAENPDPRLPTPRNPLRRAQGRPIPTPSTQRLGPPWVGHVSRRTRPPRGAVPDARQRETVGGSEEVFLRAYKSRIKCLLLWLRPELGNWTVRWKRRLNPSPGETPPANTKWTSPQFQLAPQRTIFRRSRRGRAKREESGNEARC